MSYLNFLSFIFHFKFIHNYINGFLDSCRFFEAGQKAMRAALLELVEDCRQWRVPPDRLENPARMSIPWAGGRAKA